VAIATHYVVEENHSYAKTRHESLGKDCRGTIFFSPARVLNDA